MPAHTALYELLGVDANVDATTLKKKYRKLAIQLHPDKNGGSDEATAKFQKVSRAYEILSDPDKRKLYDAHGEDAVQQMEMNAGQGPMNAGDIFSNIFGGGGHPFDAFFGGGGRRGHTQPPNATCETTAKVSLKTIVQGGTVEIPFTESVAKHLNTGQACTDFVTCEKCNGQGQVVFTRQMGPMIQQSRGTCKVCQGRGYVIHPEKENHYFWMEEIKSYSIEVPPGVSLTKPIVMPGKGSLYLVPPEESMGTEVKRGDLLVQLNCETDDDSEWQLHNPQLRHLQWTPELQVIYGLTTNRIRCPHINGKEYILEIPKECMTDSFVVPSLGLPGDAADPHNPYADVACGDLIIKIRWDFNSKTLQKASWFQQMRKGLYEKAPWTDPDNHSTKVTRCLSTDDYETYLKERRHKQASGFFGSQQGGGREGPQECVQS